MTRSRATLTALALVVGLLIGGAGTQAAYWADACVAKDTVGGGASREWLNRCRT